MGYTIKNKDGEFPQVYLQTGMKTDNEAAWENVSALEEVVNQPVGLFLNNTDGVAGDVAEYLPNHHTMKDVLNEYSYRKINNELASENKNGLVVMHSAGNEDFKKAMGVGALYEHKYPNLSVVSVGSPVSNSGLTDIAKPRSINYLGQANNLKDPVTNSKTWIAGTGALLIGGGLLGATLLAPVTGGSSLATYFSVLAGGGIGIYGLQTYHPFIKYSKEEAFVNLIGKWKDSQGATAN